MDSNLLERLVKLETLVQEKQETLYKSIQELKAKDTEVEEKFIELLQKHTEEEMKTMKELLESVKNIEQQTAHFKSVIGGVVITVSAVWFVLSQVAAWLHLDFIQILNTALSLKK